MTAFAYDGHRPGGLMPRPHSDDELEDLAEDRANEIDTDDEAGDRYAQEIYRND